MSAEFKLAILNEAGLVVDTYEDVRVSDVTSGTFAPAIARWMSRSMRMAEANPELVKRRIAAVDEYMRDKPLNAGGMAGLVERLRDVKHVVAEADAAAPTPIKISKVRMVCDHCESEHVQADAFATWDYESQEWKLASTFDKGAVCDSCGGGCRIKSVSP